MEDIKIINDEALQALNDFDSNIDYTNKDKTTLLDVNPEDSGGNSSPIPEIVI